MNNPDKEIILDLDNPSITPPTLYEINQSLDYAHSKDGRYKGLKGEYYARMVVFTNFVLGRKPVLLKGPRSSGKTAIMSVMSDFCQAPMTIAMSSDKAEYRDFEELNKATHFIIPEINKVSDIVVEILKDMGEGAKAEYKYINEYKLPQKIEINPKPFITSIADENKNQGRLGEELISRLTSINTDASVDQNLRVISDKFRKAQNPYGDRPVSDDRLEQIKNYVRGLPSINDMVFIYLPGVSVMKVIPPQFTDSRRDTDKYIDNTKGIALFHYPQRMIIEHKKKKHLFITPEDVWYNHIIYNEVLLQSALKAGPLERKIIEILRNTNGALMTVGEIRNTILNSGLTPSNESVRKACDNLSEIGYLTRIEDSRPFKYDLNHAIKSSYTGTIDWKAVVEECKRAINEQFPKHANEYTKRFCGESILVTNPFTGEVVDIMKYTEKIKEPTPPTKPIIKPNKPEKKQTKTDDVELLRQKITDLLKDGPLEFDILYKNIRMDMVFEEQEVERELNFLRTMGEIIYDKGKARLLT